jgi:acetyl-CoA carboxylase biotin carboxyl carrier protein
MTDTTDELAGIEAAARDLVADLTERLERHGLGEIEVRRGDLRVRVARGDRGAAVVAADAAGGAHAPAAGSGAAHGLPSSADQAASESGAPGRPAATSAPTHPVSAPAVGYFVYGEGLGPGMSVEKGDPLGYVDVLGVRHEVRAPRSGTVHSLVTETGEAVEYGQVLIELGDPVS